MLSTKWISSQWISQLLSLILVLCIAQCYFMSNRQTLNQLTIKPYKDFKQTSWSLYVSGKLPSYPSPKLTFCPKWEVSANVDLGRGRWGSFGREQSPTDLIQKIEKTVNKTNTDNKNPRNTQYSLSPLPSPKEFFVGIPDVTYVLREI